MATVMNALSQTPSPTRQTTGDELEIFLAAAPGLEPALRREAEALGFDGLETVAGGVRFRGDWPTVWRANLLLRGATRVLARFATFPAPHLAQLDKRARKIAWDETLRPDVPVTVAATSKRSRIYHTGAAAQRVETAIRETLGAPIGGEAAVRVVTRLENDVCAIGVDASGEPLHKRGFKQAVGKAPMRETLAALLLGECGYRGDETVVDPMCGSGAFIVEAAEIAAGLAPGRGRRFAFEDLASFDAATWAAMRADAETAAAAKTAALDDGIGFFGSDRDAGAVDASRENARRAGVEAIAAFEQRSISDLTPPEGAPGLVIANPPYGARIGDAKRLTALYDAFGRVLLERFSGWRVGLVATEPALARATKLPFRKPGPPIPHGALRIKLYQTGALP